MLVDCHKLKDIRERKLISREKLADEIGYSFASIYRIEEMPNRKNGASDTVKMKISTLKAICKALQVKESELIARDAA